MARFISIDLPLSTRESRNNHYHKLFNAAFYIESITGINLNNNASNRRTYYSSRRQKEKPLSNINPLAGYQRWVFHARVTPLNGIFRALRAGSKNQGKTRSRPGKLRYASRRSRAKLSGRNITTKTEDEESILEISHVPGCHGSFVCNRLYAVADTVRSWKIEWKKWPAIFAGFFHCTLHSMWVKI